MTVGGWRGGMTLSYLCVGAQDLEGVVVALAVLLHALCELAVALDVVLKGLVVAGAGLYLGELPLQLLQAHAQILVVLVNGGLNGDVGVGHQQLGEVLV